MDTLIMNGIAFLCLTFFYAWLPLVLEPSVDLKSLQLSVALSWQWNNQLEKYIQKLINFFKFHIYTFQGTIISR